jgi:hypothetical protein
MSIPCLLQLTSCVVKKSDTSNVAFIAFSLCIYFGWKEKDNICDSRFTEHCTWSYNNLPNSPDDGGSRFNWKVRVCQSDNMSLYPITHYHKKWQLQTESYITSAIYTCTLRQQWKKSHFGSQVHPPPTQISNTVIHASCLHQKISYF